ncbi:MAG: AAA domain-containing protein [Planctomycetes bacterium]|nr:AAA domain-containing protein [Planctomycetota bacterium]
MSPPTPDDTRDALTRLLALWRREREATHARVVEERRGTPLAERVARGLAARDLRVLDTDPAPGERTLVWLGPARPDAFRHLRVGVGDPVRLWRQDPDGPDAVQGVVSHRRAERLGVMLQGDRVDEALEALEEGPFHLDRDDPQATFERGARALERCRAAAAGSDAARLRAVLFGERPPRFGPEPALTPDDPDLNAPQVAAVARALAAEDLALIHGPPGTGKTRTLVEVARQAVARGERVLATAASNAAVDTLAERLVRAGLDVVRAGHPARVAPALEAHTLDALLQETEAWALARRWKAEAAELRRQTVKRKARGRVDRDDARDAFREARALMRDARKALEGATAALLRRAQVVCATAAGADAALLGDEAFDLVVLDEATQATDPIALVPLLRGRRAVLAGDPCQLAPTVIDREAERQGLGRTFFERLREGHGGEGAAGDALRLLVVQHRMHAAIMGFPSRMHYDDRLVASPEVIAHRLEDLGALPDPLREGPLVFLDAAGTGWEERRAGDDPSTSNPGLAARVALEVRRLLSRGVAPADAALITPYEAQARLHREALAAEVAAGLEVGTVDGFQGREKEAIVVDLVRSNDDGAVGFLADVRRMNVALTRARRFLLVCGDSATLGQHPYYAAFLEHVGAAGVWTSAYADDGAPLEPG